ncbi:MAG: hypothetical protein Q8Q20_04700, partial [bacterium]|nr:hypothetical protein [bacterium]
MAVAELRKLGIIGLQSEQTAVLGALHEFGKFQIIRQGENDIDESVSQHEYALAQLKFTLDFIHRYKAEEKLSFREKMHRALTKGLRVNKQEVERIVREFDYKKVVQRAEKLESNINLAQSHVHNLEGEIAELEPWRNLRGAPRQDSQSVTIRFGVVSKERYELLSAAVQSQNLAAEVVPVDQSDKEVRAMIVYHAEAKKAVEPLLVEASFSDVVLPEISSPPAEAIELKRKEIETIHNQISAWKEEAEALSKDQPSLQILFDHTSWMKVRAEASLQGLRNQK